MQVLLFGESLSCEYLKTAELFWDKSTILLTWCGGLQGAVNWIYLATLSVARKLTTELTDTSPFTQNLAKRKVEQISHFFSLVYSHRCLLVLLDSLLCPSHPAGPLSGLSYPSGADERGNVARLRQQRSQPRHLHSFQHRIQEPFQKAAASLLLQEGLRRRLQGLFQMCSSSRRRWGLCTDSKPATILSPVRIHFLKSADSRLRFLRTRQFKQMLQRTSKFKSNKSWFLYVETNIFRIKVLNKSSCDC